jgi:general secretion pathway protein A
MSAYLEHFGLGQHRFTKEIEDSDLWLPPSKQSIVDELVEAVKNTAVPASPATRRGQNQHATRPTPALAPVRLSPDVLPQRDARAPRFYRHLCHALVSPLLRIRGRCFERSPPMWRDQSRDRVHPVFLLDEAHFVQQVMLEHLHVLLNYEWDRKALLSVILIGLPELSDRL